MHHVLVILLWAMTASCAIPQVFSFVNGFSHHRLSPIAPVIYLVQVSIPSAWCLVVSVTCETHQHCDWNQIRKTKKGMELRIISHAEGCMLDSSTLDAQNGASVF